MIGEGSEIIIVSFEELKYFDLPHLFHFYVIKVILFGLYICAREPTCALGSQEALEYNDIKLAIGRGGHFGQ